MYNHIIILIRMYNHIIILIRMYNHILILFQISVKIAKNVLKGVRI